jgi:hypothetical protein
MSLGCNTLFKAAPSPLKQLFTLLWMSRTVTGFLCVFTVTINLETKSVHFAVSADLAISLPQGSKILRALFEVARKPRTANSKFGSRASVSVCCKGCRSSKKWALRMQCTMASTSAALETEFETKKLACNTTPRGTPLLKGSRNSTTPSSPAPVQEYK